MSKQTRLTIKLTVRLVLSPIINEEPLQNYFVLGSLIAAWAGAKIAERSIYSTMTLIITE